MSDLLTRPETPARPVELVDAHVHLLDLEAVEYPWIASRRPQLEALLDDYYEIARDYALGDYRGDVVGVPITQSVACEFGAADSLVEAAWVQRCADADDGPSGFVAGVDLLAPSLADTLARLRELPVVRAVRQPLYWAEDPLRCLGPAPGLLTDPAWLRGFELVAEHGLTWDLLVYDEQLPEAHGLLGSFPETPVVLEAIGWPLDRSAEGFERWTERLQALSAFSNVTLKLQGLALLFGGSREAIEPWVRRALAIFGAQRCMFATHFPVDRLLWSATELVAALRAIVGGLSTEDQHAFFAECARRTYRLPKGAHPDAGVPAGEGRPPR